MKYVLISVHDYKGGEIGTPEFSDNIEELLLNPLELMDELWNEGRKFNVDWKNEAKDAIDKVFQPLYAGFGSCYEIHEIGKWKIPDDKISEKVDYKKLYDLIHN